MSEGNEWLRDDSAPLPPRVEQEVREIVSAVLITACEEITKSLGHGDSVQLMATMAISFERFPGDTEPFLAVGSFPDDPRVAWAFIHKIHTIMEEAELGSE